MQNLCRVSLAVFLGDFTGTCTGDSCTILRDNSADDDNKNLLSVQRKSSSLLVQGMVYDENGKVIVAIEDSRPHINRNNVFGWKRPDEHTLEVTDQKDRTVLHIRFMNKTTIYVEGLFYTSSGNSLRVKKDVLEFAAKRGGTNSFSFEGGCAGTFGSKGTIFAF